MSGKVTPHFSWNEAETSLTATKLSINNSIPDELKPRAICLGMSLLEPARYLFGLHMGKEISIQVNSWFRCRSLNFAIKGSKTSAHMAADAADIEPWKLDRLALWPTLLQMLKVGFPIDQVVLYEDMTHIHIGQRWQKEPRRQALVKVAEPGTNGAAPGKSYVLWKAYKGMLKAGG